MPKIGQPIRRATPRMVSINRLAPGSRFLVPNLGITGTVLMSNECRAHVRVDGGTQEVTIKNKDGSERTFRASKSRDDDWSPGVLVTPIFDNQGASTMPSVPTISPDVAAAVADKPVKAPKAKPAKGFKPAETKASAKPAKKPTKAESNGKAAKEGLRAPQERILKALLKHDGGLPWAKLAAKAEADPSSGTSLIGSTDDDTRLKNDKRKFPSLISLGLVRRFKTDDAGDTLVTLTAAGKKAAAKVE